MKLILTLFTSLLFVSTSNATDFEKYDKHIWKAMLSFKDKNYKESLINFEIALKTIPNENTTDYFYAGAAALQLNKNEKAKKLIITAIQKTKASERYFDSFKEFKSFRDRKLFSEIKKNYSQYISDFYNNLEHPKIYKEIDSLLEIDQKVRKNGSSWKKMARVDSLNVTRLIEITKKYGWQSKGWLILWHQRGTFSEKNYVWDFFKPHIDKEIAKGKIRKDFWAMFEEHESILENKKQIYGLFLNNFEQFPIIDIEKVDERREKIGKPPLWYMRKVYGYELPSEYKKSAPKN